METFLKVNCTKSLQRLTVEISRQCRSCYIQEELVLTALSVNLWDAKAAYAEGDRRLNHVPIMMIVTTSCTVTGTQSILFILHAKDKELLMSLAKQHPSARTTSTAGMQPLVTRVKSACPCILNSKILTLDGWVRTLITQHLTTLKWMGNIARVVWPSIIKIWELDSAPIRSRSCKGIKLWALLTSATQLTTKFHAGSIIMKKT